MGQNFRSKAEAEQAALLKRISQLEAQERDEREMNSLLSSKLAAVGLDLQRTSDELSTAKFSI
jgi:hypothetical protein